MPVFSSLHHSQTSSDSNTNIQALSGHLKQVAEALEIQAVLAQVDAGTLDIKE
ncbi:hypothetical protein P4S72_27255 [Vibrio sp. PP-XX7]